MKKIFYCSLVILISLSFTNCNNGGSDTGKKVDSTDKSKMADTMITGFNKYLNVDTSKVVGFDLTKIPDFRYRADVLTEELKSIFTMDSTAFDNKYIHAAVPIFTAASANFIFSVRDLYVVMQQQLHLEKAQETADIFNGVRVYPALETKGGTKTLYLVFMGEKATVNPLILTTMRTSNAFTVKNNVFSRIVIGSAQFAQLEPDIKAFQTFWMTSEGAATKDDINRNACFSIAEYYQVLDLLDTNMLKDTVSGAGGYKVALYPCLDNKKLRFVIKGMQGNTPMINRSFFNNMDVCPTNCPTNEIQ